MVADRGARRALSRRACGVVGRPHRLAAAAVFHRLRAQRGRAHADGDVRVQVLPGGLLQVLRAADGDAQAVRGARVGGPRYGDADGTGGPAAVVLQLDRQHRAAPGRLPVEGLLAGQLVRQRAAADGEGRRHVHIAAAHLDQLGRVFHVEVQRFAGLLAGLQVALAATARVRRQRGCRRRAARRATRRRAARDRGQHQLRAGHPRGWRCSQLRHKSVGADVASGGSWRCSQHKSAAGDADFQSRRPRKAR